MPTTRLRKSASSSALHASAFGKSRPRPYASLSTRAEAASYAVSLTIENYFTHCCYASNDGDALDLAGVVSDHIVSAMVGRLQASNQRLASNDGAAGTVTLVLRV